jgi:hypothetical protein
MRKVRNADRNVQDGERMRKVSRQEYSGWIKMRIKSKKTGKNDQDGLRRG